MLGKVLGNMSHLSAVERLLELGILSTIKSLQVSLVTFVGLV